MENSTNKRFKVFVPCHNHSLNKGPLIFSFIINMSLKMKLKRVFPGIEMDIIIIKKKTKSIKLFSC